MTLRQRIEQRITDLRVERDIAAAATPGPWEVHDRYLNVVLVPGDFDWVGQVSNRPRDKWCADATHIAAQDPATTIARIDRELAGCAADLALLDDLEQSLGGHPLTPSVRWGSISLNLATDALLARYPEGDNA